MKVGEIMSREVVVASPDTPVTEAARRMVQARVGSAVVVQGAWIVGILTERDVLRAAASGQDLTSSPVKAWMTPDPTTATPDTALEEAAELMMQGGFRHLPVVEGREVRGVVSLRDLFAARIRRPPGPAGPGGQAGPSP